MLQFISTTACTISDGYLFLRGECRQDKMMVTEKTQAGNDTLREHIIVLSFSWRRLEKSSCFARYKGHLGQIAVFV